MANNQASVAVGVAMILAGFGLWGVAAYAQVQRISAAAVPAAASSCPSCPICPTCTAAVVPTTTAPKGSATAAIPAASASSAPAASASATASASAASAPAGAAEVGGPEAIFRFEAGKFVLPNDEKLRLIAHIRELQKQPKGKIVIEGFGDSETPDGLALGKRRAAVTRLLLTDVMFDSDRLVVPNNSGPPALTSAVRIRLMEKAP